MSRWAGGTPKPTLDRLATTAVARLAHSSYSRGPPQGGSVRAVVEHHTRSRISIFYTEARIFLL